MKKIIENIRLKTTCVNVLKIVYKKPTANFILMDKSLKSITEVGDEKRMPFQNCAQNLTLSNKANEGNLSNTNRERNQTISICR